MTDETRRPGEGRWTDEGFWEWGANLDALDAESRPRLYRVHSTIDELDGRKNVAVNWFFADERETPPAPYAEVIEGYDPADEGKTYPEGAIDEAFTLEEAHALADYLRDRHADETEITELRLPIRFSTMGCGAIPVGGPQGFLKLEYEPDYPLPFKVWGYYDLRQHEDEPDRLSRYAGLMGPERPGELRDAFNALDGSRQEIADALGTEHPLFRLVDGALRSGDLDELRTARAAVAGLDDLEVFPF